MIAWKPMMTDEMKPNQPAEPAAGSLLYRLTVVFPSWAGALLVLYSIFMWKFGGLKVRPR